ncbi:MAG: caspase family protein [Planctomycetes bacterium]|nr:caspase family protein [Planctomycetota bacterium]MBI3845916.1 caspase family protein [Planctomycetota bacterium]
MNVSRARRPLASVLAMWALIGAAHARAEHPALSGQLCSRVDNDLKPVAPATPFFADTPFVVGVVHADGDVPAGEKLRVEVWAKLPISLADGEPVVANGKATDFVLRVPLAGRSWASRGGTFKLRIFWNDDDVPALSLPFDVVTSNRWALLVGIEDYPPVGPENDLPGCALDVKHMKEMLNVSFGVPDDHVTTLVDAAATKANIEGALIAMADKAGPDDAAIFYYSGHGAQVPDLDGDEDDGWDEAIVPVDPHPNVFTTQESLKPLLIDDRIGELLARFKTRNVTVIFDSCHSGTAVRAADAPAAPISLCAVKKQDLQFSRDLVAKSESVLRKFSVKSNGPGLDVDKRFVLIAGCRPWETSGSNPMYGGFLTHFLVDELAQSQDESWESIVSRVRESMTGARLEQCPVVEGASRRYPFSLVERRDDAPFVRPSIAVAGAITPQAPPATTNPPTPIPAPVLCDEGVPEKQIALLAALSSIFVEHADVPCDVYEPSDSNFTGPPKARIVITGESQVAVVEYPNHTQSEAIPYTVARIVSGKVEKGDRAVPRGVWPISPRPRAACAIRGNLTDVTLLLKLQEYETRINEWIGATPELRLVHDFKTVADIDYFLEPIPLESKTIVQLWTSTAALLGQFDLEPRNKAVDFIAARHNDWSRLVRLANPSPTFALSADVDPRAAPAATVRLRVRSSATAYAAVFVEPEGGTLILHPDSGKPLEPGKVVTFEQALPRDARSRVLFKVIATQKPIDFDAVRRATVKIPQLLGAMLDAYGDARNVGLLSTDGWAAETLFVTISR